MSAVSSKKSNWALDTESLKQLLYRFSLSTLSAGASLILGLLSFGGMYALWPALIPALISFVLSVAYEGEIYIQNIERAFDKIFTTNYFEHQLAKQFLKALLLEKRIPAVQLFHFHSAYKNALLANDSKTLDTLEQLFSAQLRAKAWDASAINTPYAKALFDYFHTTTTLHQQYQQQRQQRRWPLFAIQCLSILTSLLMGLGTTYLLVELFSIIPVLTSIPFVFWPLIITPMAAVAGIAYALLTYNAMTNLMANNTIYAWYLKLRDNLKKNPYDIKHIGMAITATTLFTLALTLTLCTAGTWWTIAQEVPPLFRWMRRMPTFVMGVIHPIVTGLSSVVFNLENSSETLTMIEQLSDDNNHDLSIEPLKTALAKAWSTLRENENVLQWLNPFRLLLVGVILPLRYVLFAGHLISVGVTADRIPGLSKYFSAFLGSLSEGFEDVHYFFKHTHPSDFNSLLEERLGESQGHEHNHQDIPSWCVEKLSLPFYVLAAAWDSVFSLFNRAPNQVSFKQAWDKSQKPFVETTKPTSALNQPSNCSHTNCSHTHPRTAGSYCFFQEMPTKHKKKRVKPPVTPQTGHSTPDTTEQLRETLTRSPTNTQPAPSP